MEEKQYMNGKQSENETLVQMKSIFENAIHAIIVMHPDGVIFYWNPKSYAIFEWTEEEATGKKFHELIIPEHDRNEHLSWMEQFNDGKVLSNTHEIPALRKNKTKVNIALGISLSTINGKSFYICYISDLTDRKLIANRLDKQKEFYENILNKIPTDIAVFDKEHRYLFVNPGAIKDEALRKYIVGKDDFEYAEYRKRDVSLAKKRREQFLEVKKSGKEMRWEDSLKSPEGNTITHLRRLFPVLDEKGELSMVIGFGIDITERKLLEEKQALYVDQLSSQNVQLVDFCNIVSHNLRAPLVNMSMLVTFIEESTEEQERKFLISKLKPVIENLHTTFNELVESIQIKQDIEIQSENINLDMCLNRTLEAFEDEISRSGAVIERKFSEAPVIQFPPKYLFSIFHNLISNSLKYKSPNRKPHIIVESRKADNNIILSVSDNGLGIDLVKHKDSFFKIGKVFHRNPNAKGFGLYMTKTHVDAMEGKIWAESTPDKGTTIFIEFKNQY